MADKIRLIASDLDGTLLLHGARACSSELFSLVRELSDRGIYFVPASGRQYPNMQRLFAPVDDKLLYLCENGALVMHLDQPVLKNVFEDALALELCHAVYAVPECEVLISGERTSYIIPKKQSYVTHLRDYVGNNITIIDRPERIAEPILKVSFFTENKYRDSVAEELGGRYAGQCLMMTSGNEWVDFAPLGTSKGAALEQIGEMLGIRPQEMAAFGDNENDRTMLELVGHPYIMEECNPSLSDIRASRCRRVEDELANILKQL